MANTHGAQSALYNSWEWPRRVRSTHQVKIDKLYPKQYDTIIRIIHTTEVFDAWFAGLTDRAGQFRIQAWIDRAEMGNFGDCGPVGEGVSEMRIRVTVYILRNAALSW